MRGFLLELPRRVLLRALEPIDRARVLTATDDLLILEAAPGGCWEMEMPRSATRVGQLEGMALEELLELRDRADALIEQKLVSEKLALRERLARIERYEQRKAVAPAPSNPAREGKRKARAKYRDPFSGATWSGRGKLPRWRTALIERGSKREDFRIRDKG